MIHLTSIQKFILIVIPVLFAITVHEVAHGWAALRLGDRTAQMLGRLTLNPIKHIDPIGTILVPTALYFLSGFILGWAKPVPVTWENLKNPRRDMVLVALAGPGANLLMAILWGLIAKIGTLLHTMPTVATILIYMGIVGITVNFILMVINLIPIPPLDGSRVISSILPRRLAWTYGRLEPFGILILLVLLTTGILSRLLMPFYAALGSLISTVFGINIT